MPFHKQLKVEIQSAFEVIYNCNYFVLRDEVKQFEIDYALFNKFDYCIGISNGMDSLHLATKSLGIGQGDEVLYLAKKR